MAGFLVTDIQGLPFEPSHTDYYVYQHEMAEIVYHGDGYEAVYRKSAGSGDISGDYTLYETEEKTQINGQEAVLKGSGESYVLAIWEDGTYAYSLSLPFGQDKNAWEEIIRNISEN